MSDPCHNVVKFDYCLWRERYPSLANVSEEMATFYFELATRYCDNSPAAAIWDLKTRALILGLLTAHIATLTGPDANGLVGRISNASEGSVSVAVDMPSNPDAAWFNQTQFGAMAWMAMAPFRQALYIAAPQIPLASQSFPFTLGMPFNGGFPWRR